MIYWGMCSVPFNVSGMTVVPERCLDYRFDSGVTTVPVYEENLDRALRDFSDGIEVVFLYCEVIDHTGHEFGPDSEELRCKVREVDQATRRGHFWRSWASSMEYWSGPTSK